MFTFGLPFSSYAIYCFVIEVVSEVGLYLVYRYGLSSGYMS